MAENIKIRYILSPSMNSVSVKIVRFDGFVYDVETNKFVSPDGNVSCFPLQNGEGVDSLIAGYNITVNSKEFVDGQYFVYYYDTTNENNVKAVDGDSILINEGSVSVDKIPSQTTIAIRLLSSRVGDVDLRTAIADTRNLAKQILDKLNNISQ